MKVITLWQPWATLISLRWKTIETRTHNRFKNLEGQTIAIHASKKWDTNWLSAAGNYINNGQQFLIRKMYQENKIPFGKIICTGKVYTFRKLVSSDADKALIECDSDRWGLFIYNVLILEKPIEAKGHQGVWNYNV